LDYIHQRAELARLVLHPLKQGQPVPTEDALQLRDWAVTPEDAMLALEEIARRILSEEETECHGQLKVPTLRGSPDERSTQN
jgi:hypothetical protein